MKYCSEKLILTKEELIILREAQILLAKIYAESKENGEVDKLTNTTIVNINKILYNEYTIIE